MKLTRLSLRMLILLSLVGAPVTSFAADYYWDTNPNTVAAGNDVRDGGAGVWNTTVANFTTDAADSSAVNHTLWNAASVGTLGLDRVFFGGATGGTVQLDAFPAGGQLTGSLTNLGINNITFQQTTDLTSYTIQGTNSLRFLGTNSSITVDPGVTATLANNISGGTTTGYTPDTSIDINGGGTLNLTGGAASLGFNITGNTTVQTSTVANGNNFSGFNLNRIDAGSTLRARAANVFTTPSAFDGGAGPGGGTLDLSGFSQTFSTIGTGLNVTNTINATSAIITLTQTNTTAIHTGVISDGTGKITIASGGVLAQGGGFNTGLTNQTFAGANTYTGSTSLGRGSVTLDFSNAAAPLTNILYNTGFVNANALVDATDGQLIISRPVGSINGGANSSTGTLLTLTATGRTGVVNSQSFNGTQLAAGAAANVFVRGGSGGSLTMDLGAVTRNAGSVVNFASSGAIASTPTAGAIGQPTLTFSVADAANFSIGMGVSGTGVAGGATVTAVNYSTGVVTLSANNTAAVATAVTATGSQTSQLSANSIVRTTSGTANSVLLSSDGVAYATVGGRDWAAKNGANEIVPVGSSTTTAAYTSGTATTLAGNANTLGGGANDTRLLANTSIETLRYNGGTRANINLGGSTLTTGGILVTPSSNASGNSLGGGTLTSPGSDVVLMQYAGSSNRGFAIGAVVADGTAGATGFTKGGNGIAMLLANNTYTGALNVQQGGLILTGTNTPSSIFINGSATNLMGLQLPRESTGGAFLQLGNANASGSIGSGLINVGQNSIFAVKRTDSITINNDIRGMGGFIQAGSGTTTMVAASPAKYLYSGDTTVTAGTLRLDYSPIAAGASILSDQTSLKLGGGTIELNTLSTTTHNDSVRDTFLISGASSITKTGTGTGRLRFNGFTGATGATLNIAANSIADIDSTNTNGIIGAPARMTVGGANWAVNSTNAGDGAIIGLTTYAALGLGTGTDTLNSLQTLTTATAFTGARTTNTLKLENTSGSSQILDLGAANQLTLTAGGLLVTGTDEVQINGSAAGTLRSNSATNSDLVIHQYNTGGLTINAPIVNGVGASTLTKSGTGLLTLGGANTYTGANFLNGGVTSISSNANLGAPASGTTINMNNGTLRATASVILSNGAVGTNNRAVVLNGVGGTFDVVNSSDFLTIGGQITGPGGLTKTGLGTLDLRNAIHLGPTNVDAGTLRYGAAANAVYSAHNVGAAGTIDTFAFFNSVGSLEGSGVVTNTGATAAVFGFGALNTDTTFSGQFTNAAGPGTLGIDKFGSGVMTLTGGAHNYGGSSTISGGTLALAGAGALPTATNLNVSSASATFDISGVSATGTSIGSLAGVSNSRVILGSKDLTLAGTTSTNYVGIISGTGGVVSNRSAAATQTLSGLNTYDGVTTITAGTITAASNTALGSTVGNTIINSNGSSTTGGQLNIGNAASGGVTIAENITMQGTGDGGPNFNNALNGAGGVTSTLTGIVTLTGTNSYRIGSSDANTLFNVGLITRSSASGGNLILSPSGNSTISVNTAIDNNGGGVTVHGGGGTAILSASNNDIGSVLVQNFSNLRITANDALALNQNLTLGQGALVNGGTGNGNDVATFTIDAANQTINALFGYANSGTLPNNATATGSRLITSTTVGAKSLTVGNGNGSGGFDGVISNGAGTLAFTKVGTGTQSFLGTIANSYTGDTTVTGGVLALGKTAGIDAIAGNLIIGNGAGGLDVVRLDSSDQISVGSVVSFNGSGADAGVLRLNGFNETLNGISSTGGAGIVENGGATASVFTTNFASGIQTFTGVLQDGGTGALSLTKAGGGTQIISGTNTFSGGTVINDGLLLANSSDALGSGGVTVNGGTLGGTGGVIAGGVTLAGGTIAPGASIGTLTVGSVSGTGTWAVEYDSTTQAIDLLNVTGALDTSALTLNFSDLGAGALANTSYVFATYNPLAGTPTSFASISGTPGGYTIDYAFGGNSIALVTAVPEPGTLALLTVAIVGGGLYRRSRNAKKAAAKS